MDKIILIDGNSLINRAFYATPVLTSADGTYTNAVYAFVNMLVKLIHDRKPDYMLVAFDRKEPTFRHEAYPEYKGTRKPMPAELVPQIPLLKEVLKEIGVAYYERAGIEADDIIGVMSVSTDAFSYIVTGDKDSFQLVSDKCSVLYTKRGISDVDEYNLSNFKEKTGITPPQIRDLKGLMGDSSDNIPGVKGIGEKTALTLLDKFGTIEALYDNIDELSGKTKEKLLLGKEWAEKSKQLATIKTDIDLGIAKESCAFTFPFPAKSRDIFSRLSLNNILKKEGVFAEDAISYSIKKELVLNAITNEKQIPSVVKSDKIAVFIGDYVNFYDGENTEYSLKIKESFFDEGFEYEEAVKLLGFIFEDESKTVYLYGKKQMRGFLDGLGIRIRAKIEDLLLIKYLVDFSGKEEALEDVLKIECPDSKNPAYCVYDLFEKLYEKADDKERKIYKEIELPLADVLYEMERDGFKVDADNLEAASSYYGKKIKELSEKINLEAGEEVNPNSPKQLGELLYCKLGLKHGKKNKNGYSTDVDALEALKDEHPVIPYILSYRKYAKLQSTYAEGLRVLIDKKTGLVHTTFSQAQTATGRLSSKKPNLQNIPVRDEEGRELRKLFSARSEERILVDADYSQIELRLLAAFSGCKPLIEAFNSGRDVHAETASKIFNVDLNDVTPLMRRRAKAVNFGIIYGISGYGLAQSIECSPKEAADYMSAYFATYPEVKAYMDENVRFARENGYAVTLFGRKRYIREINASNYNLRSFGERAAMNMPLQGTAADIIKIAMINVYNRLKKEKLKSRLILQVHDELLIDAFKSERAAVELILKEEMENAVTLSVPLTVAISSAENWYDCK